MAHYDSLAPFYDRLMGDRREHADYLGSLLEHHHPRARTLLELACGTGSLLRWLGERYEVTGLDISGPMLEIAAVKAPSARLLQGDMTEARLGARFDVVLCAFDSVNHLESFERWLALFDRAREQLAPGGVFVFDVNTLHKLERLASQPPRAVWFDGEHLLVQGVVEVGPGAFDWTMDVFQHLGGAEYRRVSQTVREVAFPLERIRAALLERFDGIVVHDRGRQQPSEQSDRLHLVCLTGAREA
jgi:SAM-dependent methyltransferase